MSSAESRAPVPGHEAHTVAKPPPKQGWSSCAGRAKTQPGYLNLASSVTEPPTPLGRIPPGISRGSCIDPAHVQTHAFKWMKSSWSQLGNDVICPSRSRILLARDLLQALGMILVC